MTPAPRRRDSGLTLVEMLVALAIFAVIGVAGLSILTTVVRVNERTGGRLDQLARIDRALLVVGRDMMQMDPADVRLGPEGLSFLNMGQQEVSPVRLGLTDGVLIRDLSGANSETVSQHLLTGVSELSWRLYSSSREWSESWPSTAGQDLALPIAAELTLRLDLPMIGGRTDIVRLFALPESARR
ncbi:PulJ/GspJ family protein [Puniceibacterium confluentis]|uniref:PulJ/GspJ family protein n=1 Tax=Puniceibacterium confluentis TaxID=1958944 RepID=UPI003562C926